jgi:hypothetical protein
VARDGLLLASIGAAQGGRYAGRRLATSMMRLYDGRRHARLGAGLAG